MALGLILLLAVLQGVTEFLPVSSSGHLRLMQAVFGISDPQTLVDVMLHLGTLVAVILVYRREVARILKSLVRSAGHLRSAGHRGLLQKEPETRLALLLLLGTVPAALVGLSLGATMERALTAPHLVGLFLLLNGTVLFVAGRSRAAQGERPGRRLHELTPRDALIIGVAQSFALLRGISRSGSTISVALLCGVEREDAARFSFLLSIPAILGAATLELRHLERGEGAALSALVLGALAAAVVGWLALKALLQVVRRGRLAGFAWYCWGVGLLAIVLGLAGGRG